MKTFTTLMIVTMLGIVSCKKESPQQTNSTTMQKGISYPDSIYFGKNILSYPDSSLLVDGADYEMGAVLEKDASFYLIITNYSVLDTVTGHIPLWFYGSETGMVILDYDTLTNTQKFVSSATGKIDTQILFDAFGKSGKCKIDFYENGNSITRTKHFSW